jgi:hypothetical protein
VVAELSGHGVLASQAIHHRQTGWPMKAQRTCEPRNSVPVKPEVLPRSLAGPGGRG